MRILIADDERLARQRLSSLLREISLDYRVVAEADNGLEVIRQCKIIHPELVLLDVRMPAMDGIDAAKNLSQLQSPPVIIFTTAYDQHALQAFEAHAIDYLVKPVRKERLQTALSKANKFIGLQTTGSVGSSGDGGTRTRIGARVRGELKLISVDEICFFRADQKYTIIGTGETEILIEESLSALENEFGERFIRIHRNALVAVSFVEGLEKNREGQVMLKLRGIDLRLEVSRRHIPKVRALLKNFVHL